MPEVYLEGGGVTNDWNALFILPWADGLLIFSQGKNLWLRINRTPVTILFSERQIVFNYLQK